MPEQYVSGARKAKALGTKLRREGYKNVRVLLEDPGQGDYRVRWDAANAPTRARTYNPSLGIPRNKWVNAKIQVTSSGKILAQVASPLLATKKNPRGDQFSKPPKYGQRVRVQPPGHSGYVVGKVISRGSNSPVLTVLYGTKNDARVVEKHWTKVYKS